MQRKGEEEEDAREKMEENESARYGSGGLQPKDTMLRETTGESG